MKNQTNIETLIREINEFAQRKGFVTDTDYRNSYEIAIFGKLNMLDVEDIREICSKVRVCPDTIEVCEKGVDIMLDDFWLANLANARYRAA